MHQTWQMRRAMWHIPFVQSAKINPSYTTQKDKIDLAIMELIISFINLIYDVMANISLWLHLWDNTRIIQ